MITDGNKSTFFVQFGLVVWQLDPVHERRIEYERTKQRIAQNSRTH